MGWKWTSHTARKNPEKKKNIVLIITIQLMPSAWDFSNGTIMREWILLSAECASMREKGMLPCRTSQTHSIPSWPPVATMCCWLGCLSTQYKGTLSPDLVWGKEADEANTIARIKSRKWHVRDLTTIESVTESCSAASGPKASAGRWSSPSKPPLSSGKSQHEACYCLRSLPEVEQQNT